MPKVRIFVMLVIALIAGGTLAFGTYNYLRGVPVKAVEVPTKPVVVAAADLPLGTEVKTEDVKVVQFPEASVPEGAHGTVQEVVGRGLLDSVVRNEPILASKVASLEAGSGLPPVIPPGMRAMSVRVNEVIGVAGYVLPGTHVDVLATASPTQAQEDMTSKLVLANVQVLAAGTKLEQDDKTKPIQVTVVTLIVTPEQAEKLSLASTEGKIQLALRNPLDQSEPDTPGIRPANLLGAPAKPAAPASGVRRPAGPKAPSMPIPVDAPMTVEVIRGDKRAMEVVQ